MSVLAEIDASAGEDLINAVMAGFCLAPASLALWWRSPCPWLQRRRPAKLLRQGQGQTVLNGTVTALLVSVTQLADLGDAAQVVAAVETIAERLKAADAPRALIQAVERLGAEAAIIPKGPANER